MPLATEAFFFKLRVAMMIGAAIRYQKKVFKVSVSPDWSTLTSLARALIAVTPRKDFHDDTKSVSV